MFNGVLIGNVGSVRQVIDNNGNLILPFSVASSRKEKGEKVTDWVECALFGKRVESIGRYIQKGVKICVVGAVSQKSYMKKDGTIGFAMSIRVESIELLGGSTESSDVQQGYAQGAHVKEASDYAFADEEDIPF